MDEIAAEKLIEQAKTFERAADRFREAARKLREAARLVQSIQQWDLSVQSPECGTPVIATTTSTTTTTPPPMSATELPSDRLAQLNELLRELGPSQRHVVIELAAQRGIPKNTSASYITRDNFDYEDGFWYVKGASKPWPPKAYRLLAEPRKFETEGKDTKGELGPSGEG
jgi:hypothetical protein